MFLLIKILIYSIVKKTLYKLKKNNLTVIIYNIIKINGVR